MFAIPFGRMFWKEYRSNRALWLVCLSVGLVLQFAFWRVLLRPDEQKSTIDTLAIFMPMMYAIGCGAIMFASEREDGTSNWLLSLSSPPLVTLFGKASFAIASTILLQLLLVVCSIVLPVDTELVPTAVRSKIMMPYGLLVLVWFSFGSLVSRRVLSSVFAAVIWSFVLQLVLLILAANFWQRDGNTFHPVFSLPMLLWVNCAMTLTLSCSLGWQWCRGNYVDGTLLDEGTSLEGVQSAIDFVSGKLRRKAAVAVRAPASAEYEQGWRRSWQRLVWQERHRSRLPLSLLQIVCVMSLVLVLLRMRVAYWLPIFESVWFCIWLICALTPAAMGWLAFHVDYSNQQSRFLTNRGISCGAIWLAKQYVWLSRAIWIPAMMGAVAIGAIWVVSPAADTDALNRILARSGLVWPNDGIDAVWNHRAIWWVLLTYGCAQMASLLFRRTVLAMAGSLVFFVAAMLWIWLIEFCPLIRPWIMGLPFWAMLLITWWQIKPWLLEDQSWVRCGKFIASLIAVPAALVSFVCFARVGEVYFGTSVSPWVAEEFDRRAQQQMMNQQSDSSACKDTLDRLQRLLSANDDAAPAYPGEILELIEQNQSHLNSVELCEPSDASRLIQLMIDLENRSDQFLFKKQLGESLTCRLASLKLSRAIAHGSFQSWCIGCSLQRIFLDHFVLWANDPDQTADSVRKAASQISAELKQFPRCSNSLVNTYVTDLNRWVLPSTLDLFHRLLKNEGAPTYGNTLLCSVFVLPTERVRTKMIMTREAGIGYVSAATLENELSSIDKALNPDRQQSSFAQADATLDRLAKTSPLTRFRNSSVEQIERSLKYRYRDFSAAMIQIHLIAYRLEHGMLPDSLQRLLPHIDAIDLIDPWSGQVFDYYPKFLFSAGDTGCKIVPVSSTECDLIKKRGVFCPSRPDLTDCETPIRIDLGDPLEIPAMKRFEAEMQTAEREPRILFPIPEPRFRLNALP